MRYFGRLLAATVLVAVGSPLPAHAAGACAPGTGVTIVVDFGALGGGIETGCVPDGAGRPGSDVVPEAGFALRYVVSSSFVCRINEKPATDPCQRTPPTTAYWGLFSADGTGGWGYSTVGIGSLEVPAGGSIGFRWQHDAETRPPGVAPNQNPQPTPTSAAPKPSAKPTRKPSPQPSTSPSVAVTTTTTPAASVTPSPTSAPTPTRTATPTPTPSVATSSAAPVATPTETPSPTASAAPSVSVTPVSDDSTSLVPYAAAAIAFLVGALALLAWRRRT